MSCTLSRENVLSELPLKKKKVQINNAGRRQRPLLHNKQLQPSFATPNAKVDFLRQHLGVFYWTLMVGVSHQ